MKLRPAPTPAGLSDAQIAARLTGIGGSDAPIVCGVSERMTALELYYIKRQELEPEPVDGDAVWLGHETEKLQARYFQRSTGKRLQRCPKTRRSKRHPFMLAHPDRKIRGERCFVEFKYRARSSDWRDGVPDDVLLQCQHYMHVLNTKQHVVQVLFAGVEFRSYTLERDPAVLEPMIEIEREFWACVERGEPPEMDYEHPSAVALMRALYEGVDHSFIRMPEDARIWHDAYQLATEQQRAYKRSADAAKAHLLHAMGTSSAMFVDGEYAYWRETQRRNGAEYERFDYRRAPAALRQQETKR